MEESVEMTGGQFVPIGVKIIAVLYYIGAVLGVIFGLFFIVVAVAIGSIAFETIQISVLGAFGEVLFFVVGIFMIGSGIFGFFIGRGLWKARPWARIVAVVFAALGALMAVISMIQGNIVINIFNLVIQSAIGGYLLFSSNVKQAFA